MRKFNSGKLVYGIGTKGLAYPVWDGKKLLKEYTVWSDMLRRCSSNFQLTKPTYNGVSCSEGFKSYSFFYEWCQEQIGFENKDDKGRFWHLDKDLLVKGNKIYSEDTCVFVPPNINFLLTKRGNDRGDYPIGVSCSNKANKFKAQCNNGNGKIDHAGYFGTQEEAFQAYKAYKESLTKKIANEYKLQLDPRAYQALMNYTVEITD